VGRSALDTRENLACELSRLSPVVDESDDSQDIVEGNDDVLEGAFPESEYRLFFGRLSPKWGIASWGLVTLSRGAEVAQVTYDDRPREFTREGLIAWLMDSGVDAYASLQLADLAVEARGDLFAD